MTIQRKAYTAQVEQLGPRQVRVICSTDVIDRAGEVIEQGGIDTSEYAGNPIILWSHNPEHVLGTASEVGIVNGKLSALVDFAPEGMSHKADEICAMVKSEIIKTISIGFDPTDVEPMDAKRPKGPLRYLKSTLLEISFVAIPANPEAVVVERANPTREAPMNQPTTPAKRKDMSGIRAKGLYDTAQFAYVLAQLGWICEGARCEAAIEGDASALPGMLVEIVRQTGAALIAMTEEEVGELVASLSEGIEDAAEGLDDGEAVIVTAGTTPEHQKALAGLFRAKHLALATKAGKKVSAATKETLQGALDQHDEAMDMHRKAMALHTKAIKAIGGLLDDTDTTDTQTSDGTSDSGGAENGKSLSLDQRRRQKDLLQLTAA